MIYTMLYPSPVGKLLLAEEDGALIGLWLEGQKYFMEPIGGMPMEPASTPALNRAAEWLDRYFAGERPAAGELRLAPAGSEFRKEVWKILCEIPWGEVSTYGEISGKIAAGRGQSICRPRQWAALWGTIRFPSSFPATAWWGAAAV